MIEWIINIQIYESHWISLNEYTDRGMNKWINERMNKLIIELRNE